MTLIRPSGRPSCGGLAALVNAAGGAGSDLIAAYGFDAAQISEGNSFVSLRRVERVLEQTASRLAIPDLGLRMAAQQDLHMIGPLAIAMENSRTIGEAIKCANRYLFVYSPAISLEETEDPLGIPGIMGASLHEHDDERIATDDRLRHRNRAPSPDADQRPRALRSPFRAASAPSPGPGKRLPGLLRGGGQVRLSGRGPARPEPGGLDAGHGRDPRSLQRSLAEEGTTFTSVVDRVRRSQALGLITTTDLPFSQIAARLGMNEQSSLTRAVRRWLDTSPSKLRRGGQDPQGRSA